MNELLEGLRVFGPVFLRIVGWIVEGLDPIEALAKERVEDIVPKHLRSRIALEARAAALALQNAAKGQSAPSSKPADPPPRYDEVWAEGLAELEGEPPRARR